MLRTEDLTCQRFYRFSGLVLALAAAAASAQTPPATVVPPSVDPGATLKRQDDALRALPQAVPPPQPTAPAAAPSNALPDSVQFVLKSVLFSPSKFLTSEDVNPLVQPYLGHQVGISDLKRLVASVNQLYRSKNVLSAEAVLPPQDLKDGELKILLVEGTMGAVKVTGNQAMSQGYIARWVQQNPGAPVRSEELAQGVLRFNNSNTATISTSLAAGSEFGTTDVLVNVEETPRLSGSVTLDNEGTPSTGRAEMTLAARRQSNLLSGDVLDVNVVGAKELVTGRVGYDLPFNADGVRLGVSVSHNAIDITEFAGDQSLIGHSNNVEFNVSDILFASTENIFKGTLSLTHANSDSSLSGHYFTQSRDEKLQATFAWDHHEEGYRVVLNASPAYSQWTLVNGATGRAALLPLGVAGYVSFTPEYYLRFSANAQYASRLDLVSTELYQVGGTGSIRGYTPGALGGGRGISEQTEAHHLFSENIDSYVFFDAGRVVDTFPGVLHSAGLGTSLTFDKSYTGDIYIAFPDHHNLAHVDPAAVFARLSVSLP